MDDFIRYFKQAIFLVLISLTLTACSKSEQDIAQPNIVTVHAQRIEVMPSFSVKREFLGMTSALNSSSLGFELPGKINKLYVDVGDIIKKGQLIASLDTALLQNNQDRIKANLNSVAIELDLAKKTLSRSKAIAKKSFVSQQLIDEQQTRVNYLQAQLAQLKAELNDNKIRLKKSNIYAPYDGQIVQRLQAVGNSVAAGQAIVTFDQNNHSYALIDVPNKSLSSFTIGKHYPIFIEGVAHSAALIGITESVKENTQTHSLRFVFPSSKNITHNAVATTKVTEIMPIAGTWIPNESLLSDIRGLWSVYSLTPTSTNHYKIKKRTIDIIYTDDEKSYITGAIKSADLLLLAGVHKVVPNQIVKLAHVAEAE